LGEWLQAERLNDPRHVFAELDRILVALVGESAWLFDRRLLDPGDPTQSDATTTADGEADTQPQESEKPVQPAPVSQINRRQLINVLARLPSDCLHAICTALPELGVVPTPGVTAEQCARRLVERAEATGLGLEAFVVRAHQVDPLQGILRAVIPSVSPVDAALVPPAETVRSFGEGLESLSPRTAPVPVLVAVRDATVTLADVPDFQPISRMGNILAGLMSAHSLAALESDPRVVSVEASPPTVAVECAASVPFIRATEVHQCCQERGDRALVAVIDESIDVLHEAFLGPDGKSRILAVWDQRDQTGPAPQAFPLLGTLHTAEDLERYRVNGIAEKMLGQAEQECHGTHVASIAAGRQTSTKDFAGGVAPDARLAVVLVKTDPEPGSPSSIGYSVSHLAALQFIKALAEKEKLPVVVNVSLGAQAGGHDGTSLLELSFDEFSGNGRVPGFVIVKSAGNDRDRRLHATVPINTNEVARLKWKSEPPAYAYAWARRKDVLDLWFAPFDELNFSLIHPSEKFASAEANWQNPTVPGSFPDGSTYELKYVRYHIDNGHSRLLVKVERGTAPAIAAGTWQLKVRAGKLQKRVDVEAWIDRTDAQLVSFVSHVVEERTLSIPGTARTVIAVGAVAAGDQIEQPTFSAYGRTRDDRRKPEVAAPGVNIRAAASLTKTQARPDSGTSMAAPHVTGAIALLVSHCAKQVPPRVLNANQIREALVTSVRDGNADWHPGTGYGVLDTVRFLQSLGVPVPPPKPAAEEKVSV
jgi:endonuclease G